MWVEADCNLTSGESLTRQILIGSRFFKEEFGKEPEYLWLPDVFGYSWALPQILKKSGIDTFMTTKISWNQYNRMPHDTLYLERHRRQRECWPTLSRRRSHGRSQSTAGSIPTTDCIEPRTRSRVSWDAYSEKAMNHDLLLSYGYGDGGGGVNRDMLEQQPQAG